MARPIIRFAVAFIPLIAVLGPSSARAAIINATDSGWWDSGGYHDSGVKNYFVGGGGGINDRNFFVFDLSAVAGTITAATLRLENPLGGYGSADPTETYTTFDVSTPIAILRASGSGAGNIPIFNDLGTGTTLGSTVVSPASNGSIVQMTFTAAGIAYLQSAVGGLVAIGGALTSFDANPNSVEFIFGSTGAANVRQLDIQTAGPVPVPEPSGALLLVGALLTGLARQYSRESRHGRWAHRRSPFVAGVSHPPVNHGI